MTKVLIVDDNPMDRRIAGACVEKSGMSAAYAENGREALEVLDAAAPDIVLTDLDMPEMNGLELVRQLRSRAPTLPVILMTAKGSEDTAAEALKAGASSYVPKRHLPHELDAALKIVGNAWLARGRRQNVYQYVDNHQAQFTLGNDQEAASALVNHLQELLTLMGICDENDLLVVGTALLEALNHAIEHGNLELDPTAGEEFDSAQAELREKRVEETPYRDRKVVISCSLTPSQAVFTVRDEGPGFDVSTLPDPNDPESLMKPHARGLTLIQTFMDEVSFNDLGNEITMRLYAGQ